MTRRNRRRWELGMGATGSRWSTWGRASSAWSSATSWAHGVESAAEMADQRRDAAPCSASARRSGRSSPGSTTWPDPPRRRGDRLGVHVVARRRRRLLCYVSAGPSCTVVDTVRRQLDGRAVRRAIAGRRHAAAARWRRGGGDGIEVGDTLFVYTDGLVERPARRSRRRARPPARVLATLPDGDVDAQRRVWWTVHRRGTRRGRHRPRRAPWDRLLTQVLDQMVALLVLSDRDSGYVIRYGSDACFRSPGDGTGPGRWALRLVPPSGGPAVSPTA